MISAAFREICLCQWVDGGSLLSVGSVGGRARWMMAITSQLQALSRLLLLLLPLIMTMLLGGMLLL